MNKLIILFLGLLIVAAFSKVEGTYYYINMFPLSSHKIILPDYLYTHCIRLAFVSYALTIHWQETEYPRATGIFCLLVIGNWLDFTLRGSISWFRINYDKFTYPFSYDSFQFLVFTGVIVWTLTHKKGWRNFG